MTPRMAYLLKGEREDQVEDATVGMLQLQGRHAAQLGVAEVLQEIVHEATSQLAAVQLQLRFSGCLHPSASCGSLARSVPFCDSSCRSPLSLPLLLPLLAAWVGSAHTLLEQLQEQVGQAEPS
eukprot:jgi/Botrbrau1/5511/Bobra.27_1s0048.1